MKFLALLLTLTFYVQAHADTLEEKVNRAFQAKGSDVHIKFISNHETEVTPEIVASLTGKFCEALAQA